MRTLINIITIIFLFIFPPLGLVLMLLLTKWSARVKIILIILLFILPICLLLVRLFLVEPLKVSGASMSPTIENGTLFLLNKTAYISHLPERGDIISYTDNKNPEVVKIGRIVGLPGEKFEIMAGKVYINGAVLQEPYLIPDTFTGPETYLQDQLEVAIPAGSYIILGDNRSRSSDSRENGFVLRQNIVGKYWYSYYKP